MPLIDTFTRRSAKMPLLDLEKMTVGLSTTWSGLLRDRDRSLRSPLEMFWVGARRALRGCAKPVRLCNPC